MYGLINQGVHDLAVQVGGEDLWREIKPGEPRHAGDGRLASLTADSVAITLELGLPPRIAGVNGGQRPQRAPRCSSGSTRFCVDLRTSRKIHRRSAATGLAQTQSFIHVDPPG